MKNMSISTKITPRDNSNLKRYFREINRIPLLTPAEEVELARRAHHGDQKAADRLVVCNLRFVITVAKDYLNRGLELPELISAGSIGLLYAVQRYDENCGYRFCSYAWWWIRQAILQAIPKEAYPISLPYNQYDNAMHAKRVKGKMEQSLERAPTMGELSEALEEDEELLQDILCRLDKATSLNTPAYDEDDTTLMDLLVDDGASPDAGLMSESLHIDLASLLKTLPEKERTVVKMYFGLDRPHPCSYNEIALHLGLSVARVRQLRDNALQRLRRPANLERLRQHLPYAA